MGGLRRIRRRGQSPTRHMSEAKVCMPKGFSSFFEQVVGEPVSAGERERAVKVFRGIGMPLQRRKISLRKLRKVWNQVAPFSEKLLAREAIGHELNLISEHGKIKPSDKIASIGSGRAVHEAFIAKYLAPKGKVTCIDISPEMNKIATQTKEKAQVKNLSILTASGTKTSLPTASQDKVLLMQTVLARTIHLKSLLRESRRIIKETPNARLILAFTDEKPGKATKLVRSSLERNGFQPGKPITYAILEKSNAIMITAKPAPLAKKKTSLLRRVLRRST